MMVLIVLLVLLGIFTFLLSAKGWFGDLLGDEESVLCCLSSLFVVSTVVIGVLLWVNGNVYNEAPYKYNEVPTFQNADKTFYVDNQGKMKVLDGRTEQVYSREKDLSIFWLNRQTYVSSKEN